MTSTTKQSALSALIAPDGYRVTNDLSTYAAARVRVRLGAIIVDADGLADGHVVAECYGAHTFIVSDGSTTATVRFMNGIGRCATAVLEAWT